MNRFDDYKGYIPTPEAGKKFDLTNDYVARLCRQRKVNGVFMGKMWFVEEASLRRFFDERELERQKRAEELSQTRREEYKHHLQSSAVEPERFEVEYQDTHREVQSRPGKKRRLLMRPSAFAAAVFLAGVIHAALPGGPAPLAASFPSVLSDRLHNLAAVSEGLSPALDEQAFARVLGSFLPSISSSVSSGSGAGSGTSSPTAAEGVLGFVASMKESLPLPSSQAVSDEVAFENAFEKVGNLLGGNSAPQIVQENPTTNVELALSTSTQVSTSTSVTNVPAATSSLAAVSAPSAPAIYNTYPVTIVQSGGVSEQEFTQALQELKNSILSQVYSASSPPASGGVVNEITVTQRIDNLKHTSIDDATITNSSYTGTAALTYLSNSGASDLQNINFTVASGTAATTTSLGVSGLASLGNLLLTGSSTLQDFTFNNATGTAATTTSFFASVASSTNLFASNLGIATSSPSQVLSVNGNGYLTGGLGIGIATTSAGVLQTSGNAYIGGNLTVLGNSTVIGNSTSNTLTINSAIKSSIVPDQNITYDLGSTSFYWRNAYVGTLTANNISAASTTIGGTASNTFTINSDNVTSDAEDSSLIFFRGTVTPNAILAWNSTTKRFEFNQNTYFVNGVGSTASTTVQIQDLASQTGALTNWLDSSGSVLDTITAAGNFGIGTSSPWGSLSINPNGISGPSFVVGSSTATSFIINNAGSVGIGTTTPFAKLSVNPVAGDANQFVVGSSTATSFLINNAGLVGIGTTSPFASFAINPIAGRASNQFVVGSSTATSFLISNAGNVGIGTTSPSTLLSVEQTVSTPQVRIAYDNTRYSDLQVTSAGDMVITPQSGSIYSNDSNLFICSGGACPSGTVSGTGNIVAESHIGIGTSTPTDALDVVGGSPAIHLKDTTDVNTGGLSITDTSSSGGATINKVENAPLILGTNNTERVRITGSGSVGIGTTSPTQQLSASGLLYIGANGATGMGTATSTFQGDIKITGKLDVGTIDPVYTIDGIKYATYGHSTVGEKEEEVETMQVDDYNAQDGKYEKVIKFSDLPKGSDLWLFYQITDFGEKWGNLVVSLTAGFDGEVFYKKVPDQNALVIEATHPGEVSARFISDRFDASRWPNVRKDQNVKDETGFVLDSKK